MSEDKQYWLKRYKEAKQHLVDMGYFKTHKSKWNQYISEHYPSIKAKIIEEAKQKGEPIPNGRNLFFKACKVMGPEYHACLSADKLMALQFGANVK